MVLRMLNALQNKFVWPLLAFFFFNVIMFHSLNEEVCIALCFVTIFVIFAKLGGVALVNSFTLNLVNIHTMFFNSVAFVIISLSSFFYTFLFFDRKFIGFFDLFVTGFTLLDEFLLEAKAKFLFNLHVIGWLQAFDVYRGVVKSSFMKLYSFRFFN